MPALNSPFTPTAVTTRIAATAATAPATLPVQSAQVRFVNIGPNKVFVRWGVGAQVAVTTDTPIASGATEVFTKPPEATGVAAICDATETATLFVTPGEGS